MSVLRLLGTGPRRSGQRWDKNESIFSLAGGPTSAGRGAREGNGGGSEAEREREARAEATAGPAPE